MWCLASVFFTVTLYADAQLKNTHSKSILEGYSKIDYPGTADDPKVTVNHSLSVIRIKSFDRKTLLVDVWEQLNWVDRRLAWSDSSVQDTRLPSTEIWTPDIVLYNDPLPQPKYEPLAVISSNGRVMIFTPTRFQTDDCKTDGDVIRCHFKVGSWTYHGSILDLQMIAPKIDMSQFVDNDAYEVVGTKAKRKVQYYSCCLEPYVDLTYTIKLKARK